MAKVLCYSAFLLSLGLNSAFAEQAISNTNGAIIKAPLLYVASSAQSSLIANPANKQEYLLELYNVNPKITYFSDRPQRIAGTLPVQDFVNSWNRGKDSFANNPPNADFATASTDKFEQANQVLELKGINYDQKSKTLKFNVSFLSPEKPINSQQNFKSTNLFIDFNWNNNIP